jgi:hypothetical protein
LRRGRVVAELLRDSVSHAYFAASIDQAGRLVRSACE